MECYVCGTPRPEGANYCPGCGRYCADDPNVPKIPVIPQENMITEPPAPAVDAIPLDDPIPMEESVPEPDAPDAAPLSESPAPAPVPAAGAPVEAIPQPEPEVPHKKRKRHRPVLIPVLIMVCLFVVGTACRFLMPYDTPDIPEDSTSQTGGATDPAAKDPAKPRLPQDKTGSSDTGTHVPTDESCFRIKNGAVSFLPERYDGSPILVIPAQIGGQTVTAIADFGFADLEGVTTLVLPDTLTAIGGHAFEGCDDLRGVYVPDSVTSIGEKAFYWCIELESVSIPVGTTVIGADAFDGCASLMYIFYEGGYEDWMALYNEYITPFTYACCSDGDYYHGVYTP